MIVLLKKNVYTIKKKIDRDGIVTANMNTAFARIRQFLDQILHHG